MSLHDREQQGETAAAPTATSDGLFDRREFVQIGSTAAAAAALVIAGCQPPAETSKAFHIAPDQSRTQGKPRFYNTVLDGAPVTVRAREGRPILVTPNADDKLRAPFTVREQAALLDLYDPDRARGPLSVRRGVGAPAASDWKVVSDEVVRRLKAKTGDAVLLTGPVSGPATLALVAEVTAGTGLKHIAYSPYGDDPVRELVAAAFPGLAPRPRLDRANLIVGFGADFLDVDAGLERDFASRRDPAHAQGMSRFVQLEGRLSLTGANADGRIRVRTSQLALVAAGVANGLIVGRKLGPQAGNAQVTDALARYAPDAVAKQAGVELAALNGLIDDLARAGNAAAVLTGSTAASTAAGRALAAAVLLINDALGSYSGPAFELVPAAADITGGPAALAELAGAMRAKKVGLLIVAGVNPVFDAPKAIDFAGAMANVGFVVSLNDRIDETSKLADVVAPMSHSLESWADVDLGGGQVAVQQPVLQALFDTHGLTDILVSWGALAGVGGNVALAAAAASAAIVAGAPNAAPTPANVKAAGKDSPGYHYVKGHWLANLLPGELAWDATLRRGWAEKPGSAPSAGPLAGEVLTKVADDLGTAALKAAELEVELYPHIALHDGKSGNNGWLLELPDPITRLTWGNVISVSPRRFDAMKLEDGELLELTVGDAKVVAPAYRHAGMHQDQVAVALGFGRTACGAIGANYGVNAFALQAKNGKGFVRAGLAATIKKAGGKKKLARGQGNDVIDRKPRPIVPVTTLSAYKKNPAAGVPKADEVSAWAEQKSKTQQWGMAIDLAKCNGCGKCVVGCQAENNIPVVGQQTVAEGRGMWWLRIDRYYDAPEKQGGWGDDVWDAPLAVVEEPVTVFEPMMCQQCGHAPCETVCPFNATVHSSDGLNQQVYNRCVGTRYCANNCPYKVRRYNWFEYSEDSSSMLFGLFYPELKNHALRNARAPIQLKNNPEVTVRSRGVMEKCTFCVQRIREANAEAIRDGHKGKIADGAVVPACAEVCASKAIVFGDLNDPNSQVSKLARDPRAMRVLAELGTKPSISYLTKVRHDHA